MALKWPSMCWCAVKKLLTHSLTHAQARQWDGLRSSSTSPGLEHWGPSHLPLRSDCWRSRPTQPRLQQALRRIARHQHLNDLVTRYQLTSLPQRNQWSYMQRRQTPRRNDLDPMAFREALSLWCDSRQHYSRVLYVVTAARGREEVAPEMAATRKCQKYFELSTAYRLLPIAVETQHKDMWQTDTVGQLSVCNSAIYRSALKRAKIWHDDNLSQATNLS